MICSPTDVARFVQRQTCWMEMWQITLSSSTACRAWLIYDIIYVFLYEMLLFGSLYNKGVIAMVFSTYMNKKYE